MSVRPQYMFNHDYEAVYFSQNFCVFTFFAKFPFFPNFRIIFSRNFRIFYFVKISHFFAEQIEAKFRE